MADAVAIASVVTSGVVGLSGLVAGIWQATRARRSERELAQVARTFEARKDLYIEVLAFHARLARWVASVEPTLKFEGANPIEMPTIDRPSVEEEHLLLARVDALASDQVRACVQDCSRRLGDWEFRGIASLEQLEAKYGRGDPGFSDGRMEMERHRERFRDAIDELRDTVRWELHGSRTYLAPLRRQREPDQQARVAPD